MSKKASSHDIRNKEPLDEWEGQTVLLRQEWKRLASMRSERVQVVNKSNSQGNRYRIVCNGNELL